MRRLNQQLRQEAMITRSFAFLARKTPTKHFLRRMLKSRGWNEVTLAVQEEDEPALIHEEHVDLLIVER